MLVAIYVGTGSRWKVTFDPLFQIKNVAGKLGKIADYIIQDISDPMVLQPASLDLVTLKKRESDLGFLVMPSLNGIHRYMLRNVSLGL